MACTREYTVLTQTCCNALICSDIVETASPVADCMVLQQCVQVVQVAEYRILRLTLGTVHHSECQFVDLVSLGIEQ